MSPATLTQFHLSFCSHETFTMFLNFISRDPSRRKRKNGSDCDEAQQLRSLRHANNFSENFN